MAVDPGLATALAQIDTDTTAVAATVTSLDALISTQMSAADVSTVKTTLAHLRAFGSHCGRSERPRPAWPAAGSGSAPGRTPGVIQEVTFSFPQA
jgi:hypothetical protein